MIWRRWKYRVRDCERRMIGYYETLQEVIEVTNPDAWILGLIQQGHSVQFGIYKVDIRGTYYDSTWEL